MREHVLAILEFNRELSRLHDTSHHSAGDRCDSSACGSGASRAKRREAGR
jgi:hypothetical protein